METLTKSERTKQHIIEQAAHLFNQRGYSGTSLQDIMAATGLTKGGIMVSKAYGNPLYLNTVLKQLAQMIQQMKN